MTEGLSKKPEVTTRELVQTQEFPGSSVTAPGACAGEVRSASRCTALCTHSHNSAAVGQPVLTARFSSHPATVSILTCQAAELHTCLYLAGCILSHFSRTRPNLRKI